MTRRAIAAAQDRERVFGTHAPASAFDRRSTLDTIETARAVAKDVAAKLRGRLDFLHA
jgi:hypothetical protein